MPILLVLMKISQREVFEFPSCRKPGESPCTRNHSMDVNVGTIFHDQSEFYFAFYDDLKRRKALSSLS